MNNITEREELVAVKVMISSSMVRKLKAIGTLHENELNKSESKKDAFVIGKGVEKATDTYDISKLF